MVGSASGGSASGGVCIRGLYPGRVWIQGGGSASREEGLHPGGSVYEGGGLTPSTSPFGYYGIRSTSGQYASY